MSRRDEEGLGFKLIGALLISVVVSWIMVFIIGPELEEPVTPPKSAMASETAVLIEGDYCHCAALRNDVACVVTYELVDRLHIARVRLIDVRTGEGVPRTSGRAMMYQLQCQRRAL